MQPLGKHLDELIKNVEDSCQRLKIDEKIVELDEVNLQLADGSVWSDVERATQLSKRSSSLQNQTVPWLNLQKSLTDIKELLATGDEDLISELQAQYDSAVLTFENLKKQLRFQGKYDSSDVILRITSGVGGTDAQDFAEMLERMYLRWSERSDMETNVVERSVGDEAGLKTVVIEVGGPFAYGKLKSEHGVHRLVRLSPFNSDNLRQTSFALVDVLPQIDTPDDVKLDDKDLKIDVYRSGGHGGQSVNTTDSAVRVTHLPTGIVVAIQNERSQIQNKETALKVLRSQLAKLQEEQHAETIADLQAGESANWGSQIRNYVLHPYKLVKDTRTKHEEKDVQKVLDGGIDGFIEAFLN